MDASKPEAKRGFTATLVSEPQKNFKSSCLTFWYYMHGSVSIFCIIFKLNIDSINS